VEVKGLSELPRDRDVLQAGKYVAPRMREWDRTDVQSIAIVNHQRHLPALERDNDGVFRDDVLINAQEQGFGLMTTWDLFRLTRSFQKLKWDSRHVKPLFYMTGRIQPVPLHYEFAGVLECFWERPGVVGIRIEEGVLQRGERIAFEFSVEFEEQQVVSMEVDRTAVTQAKVGELVGVKTHLTKQQAQKGARVFRVNE
jgi:hypothetical protein